MVFDWTSLFRPAAGGAATAAPQIAPQQAAYNPIAVGGQDAASPGFDYRSLFRPAGQQPMPANATWVDRFRPALEFANAVGTHMAASGGNQVGTGIGQYNATLFDRARQANSAAAGMATQPAPQQQAAPQPMQPMQPMAQPAAPGQSAPVDYRSYFSGQSPLAQTQIGVPQQNPTLPPTGVVNPAGGVPFSQGSNFDLGAWQTGAQVGRSASEGAINQAEEARRAATFDPNLINASNQLSYQDALLAHQRAQNPLPELGRVGQTVYSQDPLTGNVTPMYTAPSEDFSLSPGAQRYSYGPDGQPQLLASAPRAEPAGSWVNAGVDAQGNVILMNPTTGQRATGGRPTADATARKDDPALRDKVVDDVLERAPEYMVIAQAMAKSKSPNGAISDFYFIDPVTQKATANVKAIMQYLPEETRKQFLSDIDQTTKLYTSGAPYSEAIGLNFKSNYRPALDSAAAGSGVLGKIISNLKGGEKPAAQPASEKPVPKNVDPADVKALTDLGMSEEDAIKTVQEYDKSK